MLKVFGNTTFKSASGDVKTLTGADVVAGADGDATFGAEVLFA